LLSVVAGTVLHRFRDLDWRCVLPVTCDRGMRAIGSGIVLGREGLTVQIDGMVGDSVAGWLRATPRKCLTLLATGAGAALAGTFNAPLASLVLLCMMVIQAPPQADLSLRLLSFSQAVARRRTVVMRSSPSWPPLRWRGS
jgi:H+/Cl- antiporter ClcA